MTDVVEKLRAGHYITGPRPWEIEAADEIERLRRTLKGIEIALARDGDIDGAMRCILKFNGQLTVKHD